MRGWCRGFSLLEVLTAVGIATVLTAVALPAYFRTVERGRRTEATLVLALIRASQLRYEAEQQTFTTAWNDLDIEDPSPSSRYFTYVLASADASDFEAQAQRIGGALPYRLVITRAGPIVEEEGAIVPLTAEDTAVPAGPLRPE